MIDDELLQDTPHRAIVRIGDTVRRPVHPWTPTIHELLRHLDAVGFRPSGALTWPTHRGTVGAGEVVCHGDFGPWNLVWQAHRPVGIIDWDYARPLPPIQPQVRWAATGHLDEVAQRIRWSERHRDLFT